MKIITATQKKDFLNNLDDRFCELLKHVSIYGESNFVGSPRFSAFVLVDLARNKLRYSKNTSDADVYHAIRNQFLKGKK